MPLPMIGRRRPVERTSPWKERFRKLATAGYERGRAMLNGEGVHETVNQETRQALIDDLSQKPLEAKELWEMVHQRNFEKFLMKMERKNPVLSQQLAQIIEQAEQQGVSGRELHRALAEFFSHNNRHFPGADEHYFAKKIRVVLTVLRPEYAESLPPLDVRKN